MIKVVTNTDAINIYAGDAGVQWAGNSLPTSPAIIKASVRIHMLLPAAGARIITLRVASLSNRVVYTEFDTPIPLTAESLYYAITTGEIIFPTADGLAIEITSDASEDVNVTTVIDVYSDDVEYYFAYRAAEASPTADSAIERIKAIDAAVPLISTQVASDVWSVATRTLTTPASDFKATGFSTHVASDIWSVAQRVLTAATNLGIPTSDNNATATWAKAARTLTAGTNLNIPTSDAIADAVLTTDVSDVQDTASAHSLTTVVLATTESGITSDAWTIRKTDGTTFVVKTVTSDADANPITNVT